MPREMRYCRPRRDPDESLLAFLSKKFPYLADAQWHQHIAAGDIRVNGETLTDGSYVLQQGDIIRFSPPRSLEPPVDSKHIEILYEDSTLIVVAKNGNLPIAEGGRYCENTLVEVLRRCGTLAFYTAATRIGCAGTHDGTEKVSHFLTHAGNIVEGACNAEGSTAMEANSEEAEISTSPASRRRVEDCSQMTPAVCSGLRTSVLPPETPTMQQRSPLNFFTVQRLDKETSGVVVLAKNRVTAGILASQLAAQTKGCTDKVESRLRERGHATTFTSATFDELLQLKAQSVHKTYIAVLQGAAPEDHTFVVVNYMDCMAKHPTHAQKAEHARLKRLKMCCEPITDVSSHAEASLSTPPKEHHTQWGRLAASRICVLASNKKLGLTCVQVELLTGRSHQIRLHCAAVGYPVLGDKLYTTMTPGREGGATTVSDAVYLERVRREDDPFLPIEDDGSGEGGTRRTGKMWCRRHLLHATRITFTHPDISPARLMTFTVSPVPFFTSDVRFECEDDSLLFSQWLMRAVSRSLDTTNSLHD
ncbi:RNA pseudouridylate synthase-like protein [Leishmania tarentolae]|uniref:RNA pseudouridylate synthase-like protein n=1 Tax=Leishmania tarentolae TaxID=5689 RepID=A0A640KM53_LEITA|nr:RNA pseudouridylate synthase-like protein [Leishmania tarentolae]